MDNYQLISSHFHSTIETIAMSVDLLAASIERASEQLVGCLLADGKILVCGSGADGALAQLFVSNLVAQYAGERPPLPAIALNCDSTAVTAIAQASSADEIYARQLQALGQPGDVLLCISSCPQNSALKRALGSARERNMRCILLSNDSSELAELLDEEDTAIQLACTNRASAVELQLMTLNTISKLIDNGLFGNFTAE